MWRDGWMDSGRVSNVDALNFQIIIVHSRLLWMWFSALQKYLIDYISTHRCLKNTCFHLLYVLHTACYLPFLHWSLGIVLIWKSNSLFAWTDLTVTESANKNISLNTELKEFNIFSLKLMWVTKHSLHNGTNVEKLNIWEWRRWFPRNLISSVMTQNSCHSCG